MTRSLGPTHQFPVILVPTLRTEHKGDQAEAVIQAEGLEVRPGHTKARMVYGDWRLPYCLGLTSHL